MSKLNLDDPLNYTRRAYNHTFDWYKNADTKAEIVLTLEGAFLAFITGSIFIKQTDLVEILQQFTALTWLLLALMSLALTGSIVCAIACLWSRISLSSDAREKFLVKNKIQPDKLETYHPNAAWFFQHISWLDPELYQEYLVSADKEFEVMALAANLHTLSQNVSQKHQWVDRSFALAGASLILFFLMGISYIIVLL